uniref:Ig-like domain-containing protein n=1 Tax=Sinocyclocheilus rhinocerous TaxID=307959 RepID=A0A673JV01_9TELE
MQWKSANSHFPLYSFSVTVPSSPVLVVRGATALLPCEFEPNSNALVVTWQREEDARVVHSFYYERDQLERQSSDYFNRTKLNHKEFAKGNASLSIASFGLKDAGNYLCIVSNSKGSDRGVVHLVYAAFYSEPRLNILLKSTDVTVQYETEGYPRPEVMWLGSGGQNLTDHLEVSSILHIFVETNIKNVSGFFDELRVQKNNIHLFEIEISCNIVNVVTETSIQKQNLTWSKHHYTVVVHQEGMS